MSWWCHFLKSLLFLCVGRKRGGNVYHCLYCMWWLALFLLFFCASWLNDSCAVPLTFSSLLFVFSLSLSLSLFLSCFCSFFRTNLHACLLIISLACLHDVESQAKLLASSSHHCLWCLSKLAWPIPGHPLTLDLSSTWFFCMYIHIFFFFFVFLVLYRNVTGGREVKQINVKTYLRWIHLKDLFCCECFKNLWDFLFLI